MSNGLTPAQRKVVREMVVRGELSAEQAERVITELDVPSQGKPSFGRGLPEVFGYIGGALVLGGATLLVGMSWDALDRAMRVGLLVAATVALLAAGVVIAGGFRGIAGLRAGSPGARSRIVAVLLALAAPPASMAVSSATDGYASIPVTVAGLLVALAGYLLLPSVPGLAMTGGFSIALVLSVIEEWFGGGSFVVMTGLVALGLMWAVLAWFGVLVQRQLGLGGGAGIALVGAQWPLATSEPAWGYLGTAAIAVLCFALFLVRREAVLLVAGVIGVTLAVPEAVWDWTGGALGGPLIVLLVGVVLLGASALGLRLHRVRGDSLNDTAGGT
ncbi:DUF2157 domain-containing protein [Parasphingorhabdus pacifica]